MRVLLRSLRRVDVSPGRRRNNTARPRTREQVGSAVVRSWETHSSRLGLQAGHVLQHVGCVLVDVVAEDHHPAGNGGLLSGAPGSLEDEPGARTGAQALVAS